MSLPDYPDNDFEDDFDDDLDVDSDDTFQNRDDFHD